MNEDMKKVMEESSESNFSKHSVYPRIATESFNRGFEACHDEVVMKPVDALKDLIYSIETEYYTTSEYDYRKAKRVLIKVTE